MERNARRCSEKCVRQQFPQHQAAAVSINRLFKSKHKTIKSPTARSWLSVSIWRVRWWSCWNAGPLQPLRSLQMFKLSITLATKASYCTACCGKQVPYNPNVLCHRQEGLLKISATDPRNASAHWGKMNPGLSATSGTLLMQTYAHLLTRCWWCKVKHVLHWNIPKLLNSSGVLRFCLLHRHRR